MARASTDGKRVWFRYIRGYNESPRKVRKLDLAELPRFTGRASYAAAPGMRAMPRTLQRAKGPNGTQRDRAAERRSTARNHGNCSSSAAMACTVVSMGGTTAAGVGFGVLCSAWRRARQFRP